MKENQEQLRKAVLAASVAKNWEDAVEEWEVAGCWIDEDMNTICICGQKGLKYCYTIRNWRNGYRLYPIGSICIRQFGRCELNQVTAAYELLYRLRAKYLRGEKLLLKDFSRNALRLLYVNGAFLPTYWNHYHPQLDYQFMLKMFNRKTEPTPRQRAKISAVILNQLIPYLLRLECRDCGARCS